MSEPNAVTIWPRVEGIDALAELALNLHWSWNHAADELWERIGPRTLGSHAKSVGRSCRQYRRKRSKLCWRRSRSFVSVSTICCARTANRISSQAWFQKKHPDAALTSVAYFSMEFMLSEALPIYSGGLGNVAGDQMKAASDLGVPVVGVGLLYGQGYFRQDFDSEGRQRALYPVNDPGQLPIRPLRRAEWGVAAVADSTARLEDLAALLGSVCWKNEALSARHQ